MQDKTLLTIALVCSIVGLLALCTIMYFYEIPTRNIQDISSADEGKRVVLNGTIHSVAYAKNNKTTFMKLGQECMIDIVSFEYVAVNASSFVTVIGKVTEYEGKHELIAEKIVIHR